MADVEQSAERRAADLEAEGVDAAAEMRRRSRAHMLAVSLVAVGGLDCATTEMTLRLDGAVEANPVILAAQDAFGAAWVWPKMAVHTALAILALEDRSRATFVALSVVALLTLAASLSNLATHYDLIAAGAAEVARLLGPPAVAGALAG